MSRVYNIHDAKTHFSKLVATVERGERVTICRNGEPVIECVPVETRKARFPMGALSHLQMGGLDDMHLPTDDATLDEMGL